MQLFLGKFAYSAWRYCKSAGLADIIKAPFINANIPEFSAMQTPSAMHSDFISIPPASSLNKIRYCDHQDGLMSRSQQPFYDTVPARAH